MKMSGASGLVRTLASLQELEYQSRVIGFHSGRKHSSHQVILEFENGLEVGYTYHQLMAANGCY